MYWTKYKRCDSDICIYESAVVDDLIYSFSDDYDCPSWEAINIYVLNTNTLEWSILPDRVDKNGKRLKPPDVPIKRAGHTVVAYDKKIYLWGGEREEEITNILYCFDTKTLNWTRPKVTGIIPSIRAGHSACISSHMMYIFGGYDLDTNEVLCDVHSLDLKTMNWSNIITTGQIPSPTCYHEPTIVNNRMYMLDHCTMYLDLELNQWHRLETTGNIPNSKISHSMFAHNNIIYVLGGYEDFEVGLYYLDLKRNHWNMIKTRGKSPKRAIDQSDQLCIVTGDKMFHLCSIRLDSEDEDVYRSTINVLDFNPSLKTLAIMLIIENGLDFSCLPQKLRSEIDSMRQDLAHV